MAQRLVGCGVEEHLAVTVAINRATGVQPAEPKAEDVGGMVG